MTMTLREEWLTKAMNEIIEKVFKPHELRFPPIVKIGCAPLPWRVKMTDAGPVESGTLGSCIYPNQADDGAVHIFINIRLGSDDSIKILSTIVHELVHAHCMGEGYECKHGHPFSKIIRDVGLEGPATKTYASEDSELYVTLSAIAVSIGEYPHKPVRPKETKKRESETLTWTSISDPTYEVKAKFSLTYEKGAPRDYNGHPMEPKDKEKFSILEDKYNSSVEDQETENVKS